MKNIEKQLCRLGVMLSIIGMTVMSVAMAPSKRVVSIGVIKGTLSWQKGEVSLPRLDQMRPGGHAPSIADTITLVPVIVKHTPGSGGSFGTSTRTPIKDAAVTFDQVSTSGTKVSVSYTVEKLPVGSAIQIDAKTSEGNFIRSGQPQDAVCHIDALTVSDFDFYFVHGP